MRGVFISTVAVHASCSVELPYGYFLRELPDLYTGGVVQRSCGLLSTPILSQYILSTTISGGPRQAGRLPPPPPP